MLILEPSTRGPHHPVPGTPARRVGSVRRTASIDTHRPHGPAGPMHMHGRARDLVTTHDGQPVALEASRLVARVDGVTRELQSLTTEPARPVLHGLVGTPVGPGFRARVLEVDPERRGDHSLLSLLLDDLPGAALVSGYALLRADAVPALRDDAYLGAREDLCAGWARDGTMMRALRAHRQQPTPIGPPAPTLANTGDPDAWHAMSPLEPAATRRARRIDVAGRPDGTCVVDAFFRDTYADTDGDESVVHEYSVRAVVDGSTRTIVDIVADANVLPWQECPAATASATRLLGHELADLRTHVRETFVGTTTCTHLNDVLRGLSDVNALLDQLAWAETP